MLAKHRVDLSKSSHYPMSVQAVTYIERPEDEEPANAECKCLYQSLIGSLMYLMLGTRPDITYAVGRFTCFAHDPSRDHFKAVGHIFAYVNATKGFALMYSKTMSKEAYYIHPLGTSDANYAGELATAKRCKSTSGNIFSLGARGGVPGRNITSSFKMFQASLTAVSPAQEMPVTFKMSQVM